MTKTSPRPIGIVASGPIDGTGADHPMGSYVRISVIAEPFDQPVKFKISRGAAEVLIAELQGALGPQRGGVGQ